MVIKIGESWEKGNIRRNNFVFNLVWKEGVLKENERAAVDVVIFSVVLGSA